jgi:hypothetical protein
MTAALSAAICSFQRHDLLGGAIDLLLAQTSPVQILVVDNVPGARGSAAAQARSAGRLRWVAEPARGLSVARNAACRGRPPGGSGARRGRRCRT